MTPHDAALEQYKRALAMHPRPSIVARRIWDAYRTELTDPAPAQPCLCALCSDAYINGRLRQIGEERDR